MVTKYRSQPTTVDGVRFASKLEAKRWAELSLLLRAGEISELTRQPRYELVVRDTLVCVYVGDFVYTEKGKRICEDSKGFRTPDYKIKRKLFQALFPNIEHREIGTNQPRLHPIITRSSS